MGSDGLCAAAKPYHLLFIQRGNTTIVLPKPIMLLSRETSGSVASVTAQYCVASNYGVTAQSKSGLKDARNKVNYLRFSNYTSKYSPQTQDEPDPSRGSTSCLPRSQIRLQIRG